MEKSKFKHIKGMENNCHIPLGKTVTCKKMIKPVGNRSWSLIDMQW